MLTEKGIKSFIILKLKKINNPPNLHLYKANVDVQISLQEINSSLRSPHQGVLQYPYVYTEMQTDLPGWSP